MTYRNTVKDALENSPVKLSETDRLEGATLSDNIVSGMNIKIVRVKEDVVSEKISIPYKVVSKENSHLDKGLERTVREGKLGIREKLFKVVFEDGKEVTRGLLKDSIISNPIEELVEYGTILSYKTSRGDVLRYRKTLTMRATAYTASFGDTGKSPGDPGFGITYTGAKVRRGIIAVDPNVIPLGTRVYVEVAGSTPDYGIAVAADIGGAIKGNLIDLYFDDQQTVERWGRKNVKVYVLAD
jgi:3D (Asp-Asp-Asp) domain-containing protein